MAGKQKKKEDEANDENNEKEGSGMKRMIVIVFGALLLIGVSAGGAIFFTGGLDKFLGAPAGTEVVSAETGTPTAVVKAVNTDTPPLYVPLDPPFVVNIDDDGSSRYLQVNVTLMSREKEVIDDIKANMPRLRNDLILLLTNEEHGDLDTTAAKEGLRSAALEIVQNVVQEITGRSGVENVYFTNFVMQ